ncbi:ankyrin repeat-containing domain protein [Dactylonectria macrodidyma]|uniref:Ankyrin repeat-containing domain protein n=1 Tax=Dactylonectria macrodidyma TaxID=307937 RepID=A0A9P9FUE9_9HYPO|nr:ankyrin repeat-containing domain protein [Dactylonectria macrodidyma]
MAYQASFSHIFQGQMTDQETHLIQQVLSWADDGSELMTTVHEAVINGYGLIEATQKDPWAVDLPDNTGFTPLHLAALLNSVEAIEQLIAAGVNVDAKNWEGSSPLMSAASVGNVGCMKRLMRAGCDLNQKHDDGSTIIYLAVRYGHPKVVELLMAAGASASALSDGISTELRDRRTDTAWDSFCCSMRLREWENILERRPTMDEQQCLLSSIEEFETGISNMTLASWSSFTRHY